MLRNETEQPEQVLPVPVATPLAPTDDELHAVRRSMGFVSRRNPVRRLADAALAGEQPEPELVQAVLARLGRFSILRYAEQDAAVQTLALLREPDHAEDATTTLSRLIGPGWPPALLGMVAGFGALVAAATGVFVLAGVVLGIAAAQAVEGVVGLVALSLVLIVASYFARIPAGFLYHRMRVRAVRAIGRLNRISGIPILVSLIHSANGSPGHEFVQAAAARTLPRMLRSVGPEHAEVIGADTVGLLGRTLWHRDEDLALAAAEALGSLGGAGVLREVERAATHGRTEAIREAARRIVPAVRDRARRETDPQVLLRPAGPPQGDPDLLLRPGEE